MKMWIARTPYNGLYLFESKPFYRQDSKIWYEWVRWTTDSYRLDIGYVLNSDLFPEVTFENSPMEVELVIKKSKEIS